MALVAANVLESSHVEDVDGTVVRPGDYFAVGQSADDVDCAGVVGGEGSGFGDFLDPNHG